MPRAPAARNSGSSEAGGSGTSSSSAGKSLSNTKVDSYWGLVWTGDTELTWDRHLTSHLAAGPRDPGAQRVARVKLRPLLLLALLHLARPRSLHAVRGDQHPVPAQGVVPGMSSLFFPSPPLTVTLYLTCWCSVGWNSLMVTPVLVSRHCRVSL